MKRITFIIGGVSLLAVLTALLMAWWTLFHTESSVQWVLSRVQHMKGVKIEASGVKGTFAGPLTIKRFVLDHPYVHAEADDIELSISPLALFAQTLRVPKLHIARAVVLIKRVDDEPSKKPLRFFMPLLRLQVAAIEIDHAHLETVDGFVQEGTSIRGKLSLTKNRLHASDIHVVTTQQLTASGQLTLWAQRPIPIEVDATLQFPAPQGPPFVANAYVSGNIQHLNLRAQLSQPTDALFVGELTRTGPWQLQGKLNSKSFALTPWVKQSPLSLEQIALDIRGDANQFSADGELAIPEWDKQPMQFESRGVYHHNVLAFTNIALRPSGTPVLMRAAGRIDFNSGKPQINAGLEWTHFRWPLRSSDSNAALISPGGQASLSGALPYNIGINADVMIRNTIYTQLTAGGQLQSDRLIFDRMEALLMEGAIRGKASLGFASKAWQVDLNIEQLDPFKIHAALPGSISGTFRGDGVGFTSTSPFSLTIPNLHGTLRGEPLRAHGEVTHDVQGWRIKAAKVQLADAHLEVNGHVHEAIALDWSANVPTLKRLDAQLQGSLKTQGSIRGTRKQPQINATLSANKLAIDHWRIDALDAHSQAHLAGDGESTLSIKSKNISVSNISLGSPTLTAHLQPQTAIRKSARKTASTSRWNLDQFCLIWNGEGKQAANNDARFCGAAQYASDGAWRLQATSNTIPLSVLADESQKDSARFKGELHARVQAEALPQKAWAGSAAIQIDNAAITYQPVAGEIETVKLGSGEFNLDAAADRLIAALRLVTPGTTRIDASAQLNRTAEQNWSDAALYGQLHAHTADANLLPVIIPEIDHSAGTLDIDLGATGTLIEPRFAGTLRLVNGELALYRYNLNLRDLGVEAKLADNHLEFMGSGKAGEGELQVDGQFMWKDATPIGNLHFSGERLKLYDVPEYHILASPNINFIVSARRIDVNGEVLIPTARLQPADLRGATQLSPDARLVNAIPKSNARRFDVFSNIRVSLGDDVKIDTLGLQGELGGAVAISSQPDERSTGRGELNVSTGKYDAYGQKLNIIRGRLLFNASPLDDPGLDIQAARDIEDQRVGVNVRGTLRAPRMSLFAEPTLPQSQIVSYLLTGKAVDDLSTADRAAVGNASNQLALQGGGVVAAQLGRRIGLEQVDIESNSANDTSLVLGKFLSPRLFVSYGISLTESINTLKLRYTLSEKWRIKTESGKDQSADIEFKIDR